MSIMTTIRNALHPTRPEPPAVEPETPDGYSPALAAYRGALFLDEHLPGWYWLVNPGTVKIETRDQCVLGQIYETFTHGIAALRIGPPPLRRTGIRADVGCDDTITQPGMAHRDLEAPTKKPPVGQCWRQSSARTRYAVPGHVRKERIKMVPQTPNTSQRRVVFLSSIAYWRRLPQDTRQLAMHVERVTANALREQVQR